MPRLSPFRIRGIASIAFLSIWVLSQLAVQIGHLHTSADCCDGGSVLVCDASHDHGSSDSHHHGQHLDDSHHKHSQSNTDESPTNPAPAHDEKSCSLCRLIATQITLADIYHWESSETLFVAINATDEQHCDSPSLFRQRSRAPPVSIA
ncbi:MAG: hypothetical protein NXI22_03845 [bacterium]|nr:hypothetical protein [bacterium]